MAVWDALTGAAGRGGPTSYIYIHHRMIIYTHPHSWEHAYQALGPDVPSTKHFRTYKSCTTRIRYESPT